MKFRVSVCATIFCAFFVSSAAFAMSGQEVYDKYKETEKKMEKSIKSMVLLLEMETPVAEMETTIYKKGKKMRIESEIKKSSNPMMGAVGQKNIVIDDGVTMTVFSPMMGKITNPSDQGEDEVRQTRSVKYLGKETVSSIKCHKIKVSYPDGDIDTLWISIKDSVLVKDVAEDGNTTLHSDFKNVGGFPVPYLTRVYREDSVESTSKVKSVRFGVKISNSKFDPSKVQGFKTGTGASAPETDQSNQMKNMMEMAMEIQRLYQNGEEEKARALETKMQKMMGQ